MAELDTPITREEKYLAKAAGMDVSIPNPITRKEKYLNYIAQNSSGADPAVIAQAVEDYLDEHGVTVTEEDPTVSAWAKAANKPTYTAQEVGALPSNTLIPSTAADVGAVAVNQGVANAGKFAVVGSDGNVTFITLTAWQGGSY